MSIFPEGLSFGQPPPEEDYDDDGIPPVGMWADQNLQQLMNDYYKKAQEAESQPRTAEEEAKLDETKRKFDQAMNMMKEDERRGKFNVKREEPRVVEIDSDEEAEILAQNRQGEIPSDAEAERKKKEDAAAMAQAIAEKEVGNLKYAEKNYEEAIRHYNRAIRYAPREITFLNNRAGSIVDRSIFKPHTLRWANTWKPSLTPKRPLRLVDSTMPPTKICRSNVIRC